MNESAASPVPPVRRAATDLSSATLAVQALNEELRMRDAALSIIFCSPSYDKDEVSRALADCRSDANVVACTTAGEIGPNGYQENGLSGLSLGNAQFHVELTTFSDLKNVSTDEVGAKVAHIKVKLESRGYPCDHRCFALFLIDGMSVSEEPLAYKLQNALGTVPLIGGSAGDGLEFGDTFVLANGDFEQDSAALILVHTERPWEAFKEQHFVPSNKETVVTEADPDKRILKELDGEPAAVALAELLGVDGPLGLTQAVLARNPLMIRLADNWYVRSVQQVNDDGSLTLFCGIEEGLVLYIGRAENQVTHLEHTMKQVQTRLGSIELTVVCDCIMRRLELLDTRALGEASTVLKAFNAVGFSTYGEQFGNFHINQTLTAVAIG